MCDYIAWALSDFDINPSLYNSMDKREVKQLTDKIINTDSNNNNNNTVEAV